MEQDIDLMWEYNAPKFVDFLNMPEDDQAADEWFDQRPGDEGGIPMEYSELEPSSVVIDPNSIRKYLGITATEGVKVKQENPQREAPEVKKEPCESETSSSMSSVDHLMSSVQEWAKRQPPPVSSLKQRAKKPMPLVTCVTADTTTNEKDPTSTSAAESAIASTKTAENDTARANVEEEVAETAQETETNKEPPKRGNIVTSLEEWEKRKNKTSKIHASPNPKVARENKRKRTTTTEKKYVNDLNESRKKRRSDQGAAVAELTIPKTPEVLKRQGIITKPIIKSTEQLELEKIQKGREEAARHRQKLLKYYKEKAIHPALGAVRSVQELTRPEMFHLRTEERIKKHCPLPTLPEPPKTFPEYLRTNDSENKTWKNNGPTIVKPFSFDKPVAVNRSRTHSSDSVNISSQADKWKKRAPTKPVPFSFDKGTSPGKKILSGEVPLSKEPHGEAETTESWKNRGPTVPVPFSFHEPRKRKLSEGTGNACDGYEAVAKAVYNFQKTTPPRFRSRPTSQQNIGPETAQNTNHPKLTEPKTPKLTTKERVRPLSNDVLSKEQQESLEAEEIRSYQFKAREFDRKIIECNGILGVPKVNPKAPTVPKEFHFKYDERAEMHKQKDMSVMDEEDKVDSTVIKSHPVPSFVHKEPKKPTLQHKKTEPVPFSFEQRDKQKRASKEAKIKEIFEEEKKMHEFHAQGLPSFSPDVLEKHIKPPTKCEPFNFDSRTELRQKEWTEKIQKEFEEEKRKVIFKAQPVNTSVPFVPKKSTRPLTDISEFKLNVDRRAVEREVLEAKKKEIEAANEEIRKQRQLEMEEEEARNIENLRKNLVHKPNPKRNYKAVHIKPSEIPLTKPKSPAWSKNKRAKLL